MHQVDIEVVKTGLAGGFNGAVGRRTVVNPAEGFQLVWVKTLNTDGQPIDASLPEALKSTGLQCAWIGLQGDFGIRAEA